MSLELAERCEAATGPDRELDAEIAQVVGAQPVMICDTGNVLIYQSFTASLDAAMTLVPEGRRWLLQTLMTGKYRAEADWNGSGQGSTPALALCAAALRAIAARKDIP
jgi:hypothetical protein